MNFFKRYLFKKALLEDDLASAGRKRKEVVVEQPMPSTSVEPPTIAKDVSSPLKADHIGRSKGFSLYL